MIKHTVILVFLLGIYCLPASASPCEKNGMTLDNNFSGATSNQLIVSCVINDAGNRISVTIQPENSPINDSPWYAFKVLSDTQKSIKLELKVKGGTHRYTPKMSVDGKQWQPVKFVKTNKYMRFKLNVGPEPIWVAGQELITNQDYIDWGKSLARKTHISHAVIGHSVEQRPIYKIEASQNKVKDWLVILGRQHPPEVTGALALFPFATTLLSDSPLAKVFRRKFNVLIVPNINPDGVELGFWRHNTNGVDLNRDWKHFKQPEVNAVHALLSQVASKGEHISMAVDFHSTHKDIFYTMPNDYGVTQRYLVNNWLNKLDAEHPNFNVIQQPGNNPDRGVFKQYIADQFNVHAVTYEMGDNTNRRFIRTLAIDAANSLMKTMLKDNNQLH